MGERRMFAKSVMYQDLLTSQDLLVQHLYMYLNLEADDDGLVSNPRMITYMAQCGQEHLERLVNVGYLLQFESGIVAITHWRIHNQIRSDRYKPSIHKQERRMLRVTQNGLYTIDGEGSALRENGSQLVSNPDTEVVSVSDTQDKLNKDKLNKDKLNKDKLSEDKIDEDKEAEPISPQAGEVSSSKSSSIYSFYERSVLDIYKECCPSLMKIEHLTRDLQESIGKLRENGWTLSQIGNAFRKAEQTPYLKGSGKDGWIAGLAWLCKEDNLQKVADGRYQAFEKPVPAQNNSIWGCGKLGKAEIKEIQKLLAEE